jgi:hypothetical protein
LSYDATQVLLFRGPMDPATKEGENYTQFQPSPVAVSRAFRA